MILYYVATEDGFFTDNSPFRNKSKAESEALQVGGTVEPLNTDYLNEN